MRIRKNKFEKRNLSLPLLLVLIICFFFVDFSYALDVDFWDTYTGQSSSITDKITWVDTFPPTYLITLGVLSPANTPMVYCVNEDRLIDSTFEFCIAKNSANRTACSGVVPVPSSLDTSGSGSWYNADVVDTFLDVGSGGNSFYEPSKTIKRGQIQYFCDLGGGCQSCGTTANSNAYDYYFIDKTFNVCDFDGSDDYEIRGYYDVAQHVLVDPETCATNLVCDTDHDDQESVTPGSKPSHPCKIDLDAPLGCTTSNDCWNDNECSGDRFDYSGICDNNLVDILVEEYDKNCGGDGVIVTVDSSDGDNDCETDGGFPSGYVCDSDFDDTIRTSKALVYNDMCKGWIGNSCTINSDCHHNLNCISGFCGYNAVAIYTDDDIDNKINKTDTIIFDSSLSVASDSNIQYACWEYNGVNDDCYGNSTQCLTYCGVTNGFNWDHTYTKTFHNGGNFIVKLTIGNGVLYNDSYEESYCVIGDDNFCFTCNDNIKNDDEIDIDWGGHCGTPFFKKCTNGILDNVTNETSIDYGGSCGNCDNTSIDEDFSLELIKQSNLITYPFTNDQCNQAEEIEGGLILFIVIISAIIIIPVLFLIIILLLLIVFFGTGVITVGIGIFTTKTTKNSKNKNNNRKL